MIWDYIGTLIEEKRRPENGKEVVLHLEIEIFFKLKYHLESSSSTKVTCTGIRHQNSLTLTNKISFYMLLTCMPGRILHKFSTLVEFDLKIAAFSGQNESYSQECEHSLLCLQKPGIFTNLWSC